MKNIFKNLQQGITIGLGIVLVIGISGITYSALSSLTATPSEALTSDKWNSLVNHSVPSGAVMAFNLASCPTDWSEYTPLYGRFIRGIDKSGTSIDADGERVLENIQEDNFKSHTHTVFGYNGPTNDFFGGSTNAYGIGTSGTEYTNFMNYSGGTETRPKNVALLYCVKD